MTTPKLPLWMMVTLENIHLLEIKANTEWFPENPAPEAPHLNIKFIPRCKNDAQKHQLEIIVEFEVVGTNEIKDSPKSTLFNIQASYRALYSYPPDYVPKDDEIAAFTSRNAPFNLWPYWREIVQSETARMGIPLNPLPLYRIPPPLVKTRPAIPKK